MKKINSITILTLLCIMVSCKPDPIVVPVDPCKEYNDLGGIGFKILENPAGDIEFEADTMHINSTIIFKASDIYTSVQWKIAYDPRIFTNKRQSLRFTQLPTSLLPVTMIGFRKVYPGCVSGDDGDGIDTITKYFFLVPSQQSKMIGFFHGRSDHKTQDTSTIQILVYDFGPSLGAGLRSTLVNFPTPNCASNSNPILFGMGIRLSYAFFDVSSGFNSGSLCGLPTGESMDYIKGKMPTNDSLVIDYRTINSSFVEKWYKWRGKKL